MTMLQLAGSPAATAFRLKKLRAELRALAPTVVDVSVYFEHYVHLARPLDAAGQRVLTALLDYGAPCGTPASGRRRGSATAFVASQPLPALCPCGVRRAAFAPQ
jgi:phosphoribosylformylglycinamidine synthase